MKLYLSELVTVVKKLKKPPKAKHRQSKKGRKEAVQMQEAVEYLDSISGS